MKKIIFISLLFLIISCNKDDDSININKHLDDKLQKAYDNSKLAGFSVAVVDNNKVLYKKSFGFANIKKNKKYSNHTVQNIASISKTFISLAIMKAVEQGKLNLDANINTYLPFDIIHPYHPTKPITIRHLATHTSGINDGDVYNKSYIFENPSEVDVSRYPEEIQPLMLFFKNNIKMDESIFLEKVLSTSGEWYSKENFIENAPGEKYEYSNIAAALAAFIVENVTNTSYEEYTKKHIFTPLQMDATGWNFSSINTKNLSTLYLKKDLEIPRYSLITKADGGVITSTSDFSKYLIEMIKGYHGKGKLLSAESYKTIYTHQANHTEIAETEGGIFWEITDNKTITHDGGDPGTSTICLFDPIKNRGYYFVTNISTDFNAEIEESLDKIWALITNEKVN
ncbi:serine hydrolase domain-containing protein [Aquimarina longa]|uniref:serine hydrolase domain-containing protein n=1 Tax=Aquimarina longa TaxID=1080221 RepID=UPI0007801D1D|nr:serine hydrolase domain-containing protein [Aquimarina longa]